MSTEYKIGFIVGFLVVGVIFSLIVKFAKLGCAGKEFDERQELERGKSYKCGFITFLIVEVLLIFCKALEIDILAYMDELCLYTLAMFIPLAVFAITAVLHDAFFAFNMSGRRAYMLYILVFVLNLVSGIINISISGLYDEAGVIRGSGGFVNLLMAFLFGALLITAFIRNRMINTEE